MTLDPTSAPYRVLIEDRLAFESDRESLDSVLGDVAERLCLLPIPAPDADLAIWRSGRIEAVAHCREGRLVGITRPEEFAPPLPTTQCRPQTTIATLMVVIVNAALILAALRSRAALVAYGSAVMIMLTVIIAGSLLMSIYHVGVFFRDDRR